MKTSSKKPSFIEIQQDQSYDNTDFLALFQYQAQHNSAYSAYLRAQGIQPDHIKSWKDIPPVPTDAFKSDFNPTCFELLKHPTTQFLTSGTTSETKGTHYFRSTELYEQSIIAGWKSLKLPKLSAKTLILCMSKAEAPQSSLSHMMETLKSEFCPNAEFLLDSGVIDLQLFFESVKSGKPVTLLGTALAFLQLFEQLAADRQSFHLPTGSWAMETGGYKGTNRSLSKETLYQLFQDTLGIAPEHIWNEYSMTELSSQFYSRGIGLPHQGPAWTRVKVIDPETLQDVNPGEIGYLVIYDLANYDSCMAIMTQDLAISHDERTFSLIGRDPSALPRGCSRSL